MALAGTTWTLAAFETETGTIPAMAEAPATLHSLAGAAGGRESSIGGTGGRNSSVGGCTITSERLTFGALGSTRMACSADRMAREERFFQAIETAERYELRDGELRIVHAGGTLRFTLGPPPR